MLTDGTFSKMTNRQVKAMTVPQAAAFLGNVIHETGSADLSHLDVIEHGSGAGRGMAQYTGDRRTAYDNAMRGKNANDIRTQLQYAADEYTGKYDPNGNSLIGYTRSLETAPNSVKEASDHYLNNYFRPADPEASRAVRQHQAAQIERLYTNPNAKPAPKASTAKVAAGVQKPKKPNGALQIFGAAVGRMTGF
jgi:hypothetical protein